MAAAIVAVPPGSIVAQTYPSTTPAIGGISERIQTELATKGTVDALAEEFRVADQNDPAVLDASARVGAEQGELTLTLDALRDLIQLRPNDPVLLQHVASVEEKLGQTGPAQEALRTALTLSEERAARLEIRFRLALLSFDDGLNDDGVRLLDAAAAEEPSAATRAGTLAYFAGQYAAAERLLGRASDAAGSQVRLLQGNAALRTGNAAAATAFDIALAGATDPRDRRYAQERIVAAARQAGTLPKLAAKWLADKHLPSDQLLPLARVLRETDQVAQLLARCRQEASDPRRTDVVFTPRFMNEVIGGAQEAGLNDQAEKLANDLLAMQPDNEQLLAMVVRMLLNHGKQAEADALLTQRIAAAGRPDVLHRLARLARSLGRDEVAVAAGRALSAAGGANKVAGLLLEATIRLRSGQKAAGLTLLRTAAEAAYREPAAMPDVATAFEAAGQNADAIKLLQAAVGQASDEVTSERLAGLLIQQSRYAEAVPILQTLRAKGSSPAVRAQAGQRLLDVAAAQRATPALIAETRKSLDAGTATEADLALLVDAYTRSDNLAAAAEVLKNNKLLDRKTTLSRLAVLYLRTGKFDEASATLRELVTADPENAVGTLERLASVELDRKQPKAAAAVIEEIAGRIGRESTSFSQLMGGIYDRLNRPVPASLFYRRVLATKPENADAWLLWATATAKAGRPERAIGRLLVLCDEAKGENVFSLAVDGLLNLKASPAALRAARRDAMLRAANVSRQSMLFQIIADLSDELQDGNGASRALEVSVVFSREERGQLLRELMESASSRGSLDEANACGLSMLALEDSFPPELLTQLGEQLVIAGRLQDASRAFTRAAEIGTDDHVAPRAADVFEQYGSPNLALRVFAPVAQRNPNALSFQQSFARLNELAGLNDQAFESYLSAIGLADREIAALPTGPTPRDAVPAPRPNLTGLVNGAITTARTPTQKQLLLDAIQARVDRELDATEAGGNPAPLFFQWLSEWRRTCVALGRIDALDREDDALIGRRLDLHSLVAGALAFRLEQGLFGAATRFASARDVEKLLPVGLHFILPDRLLSPAASADEATLVLPRLLMLGRTDEARQILKNLPVVLPAKPSNQLPIVIAAAVTVGEADLAQQWVTLWARQIVEPPPPVTSPRRVVPSQIGNAVQQMRDLVQSVWRILPAAARAEVAQQALALSVKTAGTPAASQASIMALQLAASAEIEVPHLMDFALRLSPSGKSNDGSRQFLSDLAERFSLLPPKVRPEFLSRALALLPTDAGLAFLERLVTQNIDPFDADTDAAIIAAAEKLPARQILVWSTWFTSASHSAVLPALAGARLRATTPGGRSADDLTSATAAAVALTRSAAARAEQTATDTIRAILASAVDAVPDEVTRAVSPTTKRATTAPAGASPLPGGIGRITLARYAATALGPATRSQLIEKFGDEARSDKISSGRKAWLLAMRAVLFDAASQRDKATDALRQAFVARRENSEIREAWIARLMQDGRAAELAGSFVVNSPLVPYTVREPLATALRSLFRGREVPLSEKSVGVSAVTPRRVLDFMTPRATGDQPKLAETLRIFLERLRTNSDGLTPIVQADPGGQPAQDGTVSNKPLFSDISQWPSSVDDLLVTLRTLPRGSVAIDKLQDILVDAASNPTAAQKILDYLNAADQSGSLTTTDRMLIERVALVPGLKLSDNLLQEVWNDLWFDPLGDANVELIFACLSAQNDSRAVGLQRWAAVRSRVMINPSVRVLAVRQTMPGSPGPTGFSEPSTAAYVSGLLDHDQAGAAEKILAGLRKTGQLSERQLSIAFLWARTAAHLGDIAAFRTRLDQVVTSLAWSQVAQPTESTLSRVLPTQRVRPSIQKDIVNITEQLIDHAAARWPGDPNWPRSMAALGRWCYEQDSRAEADRLLNRAAVLADSQGLGEHQLWVADLAFLLGHADRGWLIERRLVETGCLPAVRISSLLNYLDGIGDHASASSIAVNAMASCKEPSVVARAHTMIATQASPTTRP